METSGTHPSENKCTILLVDDEAIIHEALRSMLLPHGYNVLHAGNFSQAVAIAEECSEKIDLLVTDISLPGPNGCEVAQRLLEMRPGLRVLLISGYAGSEICRHYKITLSDLHFLPKPFKTAEFLSRVREVLAAEEAYPAALAPGTRTSSSSAI